jgi:lysophospholipase L1-like esterase
MKKLLLVALGTFLALVMTEILLRLIGFGVVVPELQFDVRTSAEISGGRYVADPDVFWREPSGTLAEAQRNQGLLHFGDLPTHEKDRLRVLCLGDSCTRLAVGGSPYPTILQAILDDERAEVFNASLPGYTSHQGLAWLRAELLDLKPDVVVVYFGWNDHWRSTGRTDREYAASLRPWRLRLLALLSGRGASRPLRVSLEGFQANLTAMAELVREAGGQTLLVTAPANLNEANDERRMRLGYALPEDDTTALHESYVEAVRALPARSDADVLDLAAAFATVAQPRALLLDDGIHLTDAGHEALATMLAQRILREQLECPLPESEPAATALTVLATRPDRQRSRPATLRWGAAMDHCRRAMELGPADLLPRLHLAWILVACPAPDLRNPEEALAILASLPRTWRDHRVVLELEAAARTTAGQESGGRKAPRLPDLRSLCR